MGMFIDDNNEKLDGIFASLMLQNTVRGDALQPLLLARSYHKVFDSLCRSQSVDWQ